MLIKSQNKKDNSSEILSLIDDTSSKTKSEVVTEFDKAQKNTIDFVQKQLEMYSSNQVNTQKQLADIESKRFSDFSENTQNSITNLRETVNEMSLRTDKRFVDFQKQNEESLQNNIDFVRKQLETYSSNQVNTQKQLADIESKRFSDFSENTQNSITNLRRTVNEMLQTTDKRFVDFQKQNEESLEKMRSTLEKKVVDMQVSNEKKLDEMRATVDEKLQKTLNDRISESFKVVSERLEQVYKSLGEMQKLSTGVDDLKKVLSNVKTRGILGEVQLGAILEQILNKEQYVENFPTKKGSNDRVEFAVKLPGDDNDFVYLPIDAKFPMDAYQNLLEAYDSADKAKVDEMSKVLINRIKGFAKDIKNKYIDVPHTTEFAVMFLPIEGLYAEVVRLGLVEQLQADKINIAGPTTMAALLSSLQMGFKTLAIQKRSSEVWKVLEGVKQEFTKFGDALEKTRQRMKQTSDELDKLVTTRTNAINRKLRDVSTIDGIDSGNEE